MKITQQEKEIAVKRATIAIEEAKAALIKAEAELTVAQALKVEAPWRDIIKDNAETQGFYWYMTANLLNNIRLAKCTISGSSRKGEHIIVDYGHGEILCKKVTLMQEMHAFAWVRNPEGWRHEFRKYDRVVVFGIVNVDGTFKAMHFDYGNPFVFGVYFYEREHAEEALQEFGERIAEIYNVQY